MSRFFANERVGLLDELARPGWPVPTPPGDGRPVATGTAPSWGSGRPGGVTLCDFWYEPWHRCVDEAGNPSTTYCHATHTRRKAMDIHPSAKGAR